MVNGFCLAGGLELALAAHKYLYSQSRKETTAKGLEREYTTMPEISDALERLTGFAKKG